MKRCVFIGKRFRDKGFLMLYIGKLLSLIGKTILITKSSIDQYDVNPYEITNNLELYNVARNQESIDLETYDYLLMDCDSNDLVIENNDLVFFITDIHKKHITDNSKLFDRIRLPIDMRPVFIYQNVYIDSKIDEKVIDLYFEKILEKYEIRKLILHFNEYDQIMHLENEYDNTLLIKHLTKEYKKILSNLLIDITQMDMKEIRKVMKQAERSKG